VIQLDGQQRGPADDAVRGAVVPPSVVTQATQPCSAGNPPPRGAGGPDERFVERVAGDMANLAAVSRRQRRPIDRVGAMPCDVSESGVLVEAEVAPSAE